MNEESQPTIPDFVTATHGFRHTRDSALRSLDALGVDSDRITVRMSGQGRSGYVVDAKARDSQSNLRPLVRNTNRQLRPDENLVLTVEGSGFFHALPFGMWDQGSPGNPGTREIVEPFDDPLQKAGYWVRQGGRLFDVHPENPKACERWIELFGLNPKEWPSEKWYPLALLLPGLARLAGTELGVRYALRTMLELPLREIWRSVVFTKMDDPDRTALGERSSRLGVDAIVGDRLEDLAELTLVIGPVTLDTYFCFQDASEHRILCNVLDLCVANRQRYGFRWIVLNPECAPRLGHERQNARLGLNSYFGKKEPFEATEDDGEREVNQPNLGTLMGETQ